jgi:ABC-2 type transport system permease protein
MIKTIFRYEWTMFIRNKGMLLALALFLITGIISLDKGMRFYNYQQTESDSVNLIQKRNHEKLSAIFDTLTYTSGVRKDIESPWQLEWQLNAVAIKPANPLSAICIGQNDLYTPIKKTRFNADIFNNDQDSFKNPEQLLAGNLDLSYFILFIFPLLLLALTYNTYSGDAEQGIVPILFSQTVKPEKIYFYRLIFRWMVAMAPVLLLLFTAWFLLYRKSGFSHVLFLQWSMVALLYTLFWFCIVLLVIGLRKSSMTNAMLLAGIWLLLLVGIPGVINSWLQYKYPYDIHGEITGFRDETKVFADLPLQEHKKNFYTVFPSLAKDSTKIDTVELRWCSYASMASQRQKEIYSILAEKRSLQVNQEEKLFWINPAGAVTRAFTTLSGSSLDHQEIFEKDILALNSKKLKYLFEQFFEENAFTRKDFDAIPAHSEKQALHFPWVRFTWPIIAWIIFLLLSTALLYKAPSVKKQLIVSA